MSIAINSNFERDQVQATFTGQTLFVYSFPTFNETYLNVYKRGALVKPDDSIQLLALGVDYSVQGVGEEAGGTITLTVGALIGDIITIVGAEPIERESVFQDLNPFTVALNQQLNEQTVMQQQTYTYWNHLTPRYNFDELISNNVRPFKRILPMLPPGHTWVGRGNIGEVPDDIVTQLVNGAGTGDVHSAHPGMRPSIAQWTGTDFILTDSDILIQGSIFDPAIGATEHQAGFGDTWGAMHWPAHVIGDRPPVPVNGDTYYDTSTNQFFGYQDGNWVAFAVGGGAGSTTQTFTQPGHGLVVGDWVRVNTAGLYVKAQADNAIDGEVLGVIVTATVNTFTIQQSGYITTAQNVFAGLVEGNAYFLDTTTPGAMSINDAVINGQISRPVFVADTATSGWVVPYRGLIVGGAQPNAGGGSTTNPNIVDIIQAGHGLNVGDYVRLDGSIIYVRALADTIAHAQVVGIVIEVVSPNEFILQTAGYNVGANTSDGLGNPLTAATIYYLSATVPGKLVSPAPVGVTKPLYASEQAFNVTGINAGYIFEQRPLDQQALNPAIQAVHQVAHGFVVGDWVYISADNFYTKGIATSLAASQVVGVVIEVVDANNFVLQTNGFNTGAVSLDDAGNPLNPGTIMYLSTTVAGKITGTIPTVAGTFTKPVYVQQHTATLLGDILEQRPLGISAAAVDPNIHTVNQIGHGFIVGDWIYISANDTYAKGIATSLATSQVVGVVIQVIDANNFVLQTNGYTTGTVTADDAAAPIVSSPIYYLSSTVAGKINSTAPVALGTFTKPVYVQEDLATNTGDILEQRPLAAGAGGGGNTFITLIGEFDGNGGQYINVTGMTGFYRYEVVFDKIFPSLNNATNRLRMETSSNNGATYDVGINDYSYSTHWKNNDTSNLLLNYIELGGGNYVHQAQLYGGLSGTMTTIAPGDIGSSKFFAIDVYYYNAENTLVYGFSQNVGVRLSASIVNAFRIHFINGNIASGRVKLYGYNQ